jgi:hypothetical protein
MLRVVYATLHILGKIILQDLLILKLKLRIYLSLVSFPYAMLLPRWKETLLVEHPFPKRTIFVWEWQEINLFRAFSGLRTNTLSTVDFPAFDTANSGCKRALVMTVF